MARSSYLPRRRAARRGLRAAGVLAPALLLFPGAAHAAALDQYSVQVLAQSGVSAPGFNPTGKFFLVARLNNRGQLLLVTKTQESSGHQVLGVLFNGQFTPIAAGGGPSPDGKTWPAGVGFAAGDMNEAGNVAFVATVSGNALGVYFWNAASQTVLPLALPGTPARGDLAFASGGTNGGAALNNRDEVAFVARVKGTTGAARDGLFLRRADGKIDPVAVAGDPLPGQAGNLKELSGIVGVNDAGQVSFTAAGTSTPHIANSFWTSSAYGWEKGTLSLVAESGTSIPGLGKSQGFFTLGPNNQNSDVVFMTWTPTSPGAGGFLRWRQGQLDPVLVDGQQLPGGGTFKGGFVNTISPNEQGQYPIEVTFVENGVTGTGSYRIDPDGTLSLIARSGMTTPLGTLTRVAPNLTGASSGGTAFNQQGQVVLTAQIDKGADVLLLLTPKNPAGSTAP